MKDNMKRWSTALAGLLAMVVVSSAEAEHQGLTLGSQAAINAFNQQAVTGTLLISGDDIVDLGPLSSLESVGAGLWITGNAALANVVDAFPALTTVGGGIVVASNPSLVTFSGFASLNSTGDGIEFSLNDSLTSVSGFGALQSVGFSLEFVENPVLTTTPNFSALTTIASSLFMLQNGALPSVAGLGSLQGVGYALQVANNRSLKNVCGLSTVLAADDAYPGGFFVGDNHASLPTPTTSAYILASCP